VITGHDHDYERFAPQTPDGAADPARGIREFVVGTGGKNHRPFGSPKPNSELRDATAFGVLKLTLKPSAMTGNSFPKRGRAFTDPAAVPVTKSRGFPRTQTNACSTLPWFSCPFSFLGPLVVTGLWAWCVPELRHAGERAKPAA